MTKIKRLKLSNFQSHKDTEVEFHPGITVIVGSSDSGKSAMLRALSWVSTNRPTGDWMISHWADTCTVEVETDETVITRVKGKESVYTVGDQSFGAFGTAVPDAVKAALPLQDSNVAEQLDAPFLISLSEGQVAQVFNRTVGLGQIDTSVSEVNSRIRAVGAKVKQAQANLSRVEKQIIDPNRIAKIEQAVIEWEEKVNKQVATGEKLLQLEGFIRKARVTSHVPFDVDAALAVVNASDNKEASMAQLERLVSRLRTADTKLKQTQKELEELRAANPVCEECGAPL